MRLIDADSLLEDVREHSESYFADDFAKYWVDRQPTIAPAAQPERKPGKWIDHSNEGYVECPFCHSATNCDGNKDELHYCFSCGADMRGGQDEAD